MQFDDTLETVLAGDFGTPYGVQSAWRQIVDLIGRGRVLPDRHALSRLREIRDSVPLAVRAASARGLEFANPPPALIRILAVDEVQVALPVLRSARMATADWVQLLPELSPAGRAVLRNRRDLSPVVRRALESYGPIDFILPDESKPAEPEIAIAPEPETAEAEPAAIPETPLPEPVAEVPVCEPVDLPAEPVEVVPSPLVVEAEPIPVEAEAPPAPESAPVAAEPESGPKYISSLAPAAIASIGAPPIPGAFTNPIRATPAPAPIQVPVQEHVPSAPPPPPEQLVDWTDVLASPAPAAAPLRAPVEPAPEPAPEPVVAVREPTPEAVATPAFVPQAELAEEDFSFVSLARVASALPNTTVVAETDAPPIQSGTAGANPEAEPIAPPVEAAQEPAMPPFEPVLVQAPPAPEPLPNPAVPAGEAEQDGPFQIAEVVARIDAFWRNRDPSGRPDSTVKLPASDSFRFETDAKGVIRWVEGVSRAPIVGLSLEGVPGAAGSRVDAVASGAFRRRAGFSNARLLVDGESDAAGAWLMSAIPVFDPANGRFTGYRGTARRPRVDERAEPVRAAPAARADSLRQLVHELRTPTNAIAGFAEMIETQMLGPVSDPYRERATVIRSQARELLGAIDDLDLAARLDSAALALVPGRVVLRPLLAGIADDLAQLSALRGSHIALPVDDLAVNGDRRAVERLLSRLMATLISASGLGERIGVRTARDAEMVVITIDRPKSLSDYPGEKVLGIDDEDGDATLLGAGFALRLARNLARELGGGMTIEPETLTLRLPAAENSQVGQAHQS